MEPIKQFPDVMTVDQAAELIGCSRLTVIRALRTKELPGYKVGRSWRVPRAPLVEALERLARENLKQEMKKAIDQLDAPEPPRSPYDDSRYGPHEKRRGRPRLPLPL
jgi:excisionase family DNA binding protein